MNTVALSDVLFKKGKTCGACYEIQCVNSPKWCKKGSLFVTATNQCPSNPSLPSDNGGWCNSPREHFDIAKPVFNKIADYTAGIVPIQYRRLDDNAHFLVVLTCAGLTFKGVVFFVGFHARRKEGFGSQ